MEKRLEGKNLIDLMLIFLFAVSIVFMMNFLTAGTMLTVVNVTNISGGWGNASYNYNSSTGGNLTTINFLKINEDVMYTFNLTVSHISATQNLTGINITLPSTFAFAVGSNGTGNTTGTTWITAVWFNATSLGNNFNGSTLSWNATTAAASGYIINNTGGGNATQIIFNTTAYTPGLYNITVWFIYNHTIINTAVNYNITNITVIVNDTTRPFNVNVSGGHTFGLNRSYANVSGSIVINVSAFDDGNMTAGGREYDITGVNITIYNNTAGVNASYVASNVTGKYWNFTLVTTKFPDGVYNISIFVNDTNGNVNNTNISNVRIDNTAPTASMSCTPASVSSGDTVTCSCSPSDVTSGVNTSATSYTTNPSTTNTGSFTESCGFADMAGNTGTVSVIYLVTLTGSGSGAGAGAGAGAGETKTNSWTKITPGAATIMKNFDPEVGIKEIEITVSNEAQNVKVSVTKYDDKPAEVTVEKTGKVNKYLKIDTQNLADKLSKATIAIQVEKSWVSDNALDKEDVALFKFDETSSEWNELTTTFTEEDDNYYYYETEVTSFSYFAIGEKIVEEEEEEEIAPEEEIIEVIKKNLTLWIVVAVVVLVAIIGVIVAKKRKK